MKLLFTAIPVLGLAILLGIYLSSLVFRKKSTPKGITIIHGFLAAISLILIIIYCVGNSPGPWVSLLVFILTASSGILLNYRDITGKSVPKWLTATHGSLALIGYCLLIWFAISSN